MALFKVTIKQSDQYNGCKVEKGMEVEVSDDGFSHNFTGTVQGQELIVAAFQRKVWAEHQAYHGRMEYLFGY